MIQKIQLSFEQLSSNNLAISGAFTSSLKMASNSFSSYSHIRSPTLSLIFLCLFLRLELGKTVGGISQKDWEPEVALDKLKT